MRIATWNLERPRLNGYAKNNAILAQMAATNADIWVLTETSEAIAQSNYAAVATPRVLGYHRDGENYTTVLSRWPVLRVLPTWQPTLAVCLEIDAPVGLCLVYGTIITYANYRGDQGNSAKWVEHRASIAAHHVDWQRLQSAFPSHHFIVAGDFNQSRDGSGWYKDATAVAALTSALEICSLRCVTQQNFRTVFGLSRSTIDHICLGGRLRDMPAQVTAWEGSRDGIRMSDHNGVAARVDA